MVQTRPASAHHLAMAGKRINIFMQATQTPRSGADKTDTEPLPVFTPRRSLWDAKQERQRREMLCLSDPRAAYKNPPPPPSPAAPSVSYTDVNTSVSQQPPPGPEPSQYALTGALTERLETKSRLQHYLAHPARPTAPGEEGRLTHRQLQERNDDRRHRTVGRRGAQQTIGAADGKFIVVGAGRFNNYNHFSRVIPLKIPASARMASLGSTRKRAAGEHAVPRAAPAGA